MERPRDGAAGGLPSREQLRTFIKGAVGRVGRREVAREFGVGPELRRPLRALLGDLAREGVNALTEDFSSIRPGGMMDAVVVRVTGTDLDGEPWTITSQGYVAAAPGVHAAALAILGSLR